MVHFNPRLPVLFYRSSAGREPVRDWLRDLDPESRTIIGTDLRTVQYGWPIRMPLVRSLGDGLREMRSSLRTGIARVIFLVGDDTLVPLHGIIKKSRKIPKEDLDLARRRAANLRGQA